jgi:RNA polymerase II subunit A small phosphatase-like protein
LNRFWPATSSSQVAQRFSTVGMNAPSPGVEIVPIGASKRHGVDCPASRKVCFRALLAGEFLGRRGREDTKTRKARRRCLVARADEAGDIIAAHSATALKENGLSDKQLLVLDVDETLVYGTEAPLERAADFHVGPFHLYRRPFLPEFITAVSAWFDLAVWSSASRDYVAGVVENVFGSPHGLRFVWSCERCTRRYDPELQDTYWLKNLSKLRRLGYSLERVVMIDDSPEKLARHYGNHIQVKPFVGDSGDCELRELLPFLDTLRAAENVRRVEKRYWRTSERNG